MIDKQLKHLHHFFENMKNEKADIAAESCSSQFADHDGANVFTFINHWRDKIAKINLLYPSTTYNWQCKIEPSPENPTLCQVFLSTYNGFLLLSETFSFDADGKIMSNGSRCKTTICIDSCGGRWKRNLAISSHLPIVNVTPLFPCSWQAFSLPDSHQPSIHLHFLTEGESGSSFWGKVKVDYQYGPSEEKTLWFKGFDHVFYFNPEPFLDEDGKHFYHKSPSRALIVVEYEDSSLEHQIITPYEEKVFQKPALTVRLVDAMGFNWITSRRTQPFFDFS